MIVFDEFVPEKIKIFKMHQRILGSPKFLKVPRIYNMNPLLWKPLFMMESVHNKNP